MQQAQKATVAMRSGTSHSPALMLLEQRALNSYSLAPQAKPQMSQNPAPMSKKWTLRLERPQPPQDSDPPTQSTPECDEALPVQAIPSNPKIP